MGRNVAVAVALVVVVTFFYKDMIINGFAPDRAWASFQGYIEAAGNNDLETLRKFSSNLSATCEDPLQRTECNSLMTGVYKLTKEFKRADFKHAEFNERGGMLYTDYTQDENSIRFIISFKKSGFWNYQVAGIRYCFGSELDKEEISERCLDEARASF